MNSVYKYYPDLFKSRYPALRGGAWIKTVAPDDLKAFVYLGLKHADFGRMGGIARAATCKRDTRGRFAKNGG